MKELVKYIVTISVITLILMFFLDTSYSHTFKNGQPLSKVQKILQLKDQHFNVAFFGSSRTENHIDCKLVEELTGKSCINFGVSGASITDMYFLMEILNYNNITFDKAFMQIDYGYNHIGLTNFVKGGTVPFLLSSKIRQIFPIREKTQPYYWLPFYRYMHYNKTFGIRSLIPSLLQKKNNLEFSLYFTPNEGAGLGVGGIFPNSLRKKNEDLDKMIDLNSNINTSLLFFTAPYCDKIKNRQIMDSIQNRIPELNNYTSIFDEKEKYFFNCGHLNRIGAKEFTRHLTNDLLLD